MFKNYKLDTKIHQMTASHLMNQVILLAIAALFAMYLPAAAAIPTNGLVAYYPFTGGSTNDFSGNGNNGSNHGATATTERFGNINKNSNNTGDF